MREFEPSGTGQVVRLPADYRGPKGGSGEPPADDGAMRERLARLEGEVSGIVRAQTVFTWSVGLMVAVLVGGFAFLGVNTSWRFGRIERELDEVRAEIDEARAEIRAVGTAVAGVAAKLDQLARAQPPAVSAPAPAQTLPPAPPEPSTGRPAQ